MEKGSVKNKAWDLLFHQKVAVILVSDIIQSDDISLKSQKSHRMLLLTS